MSLVDLEKAYGFEEIQSMLYCPTIDIYKDRGKPIRLEFENINKSQEWFDAVAEFRQNEGIFVHVENGFSKVKVGRGEREDAMIPSYDIYRIEDIPELKKYIKGI